ncbi:DUF3667 domain-containing protein [Carboxylicivirga litoralis]|uniref:DUF3667 domain-containing protein n=1 Tax=Carboxylicivirga litoralis TaxID=2816963 RepID=UPI0039671200
MLFEGNFCNNCGQKHIEHRLNAPFIWKDLIEGVFNFDSGVFFTAMQLSLRPGYSIRSFIEGKRVNYTSPIAYLIITASIFGLLYHFFEPNFAELYQTSSTQFRNLGEQIIGSIYSHYTISSLLLIPLTTVLSYVIFKKQGYRIIEHAILNIYITGHTILIRIVFFLCLFLIKEHIELSSLRWIFQIIYFSYLTWCYAQFFR